MITKSKAKDMSSEYFIVTVKNVRLMHFRYWLAGLLMTLAARLSSIEKYEFVDGDGDTIWSAE